MSTTEEVAFLLGAGLPVTITPESHLYFAANTLVSIGVPVEAVRRSLRRVADNDALWEMYARVQDAVAAAATPELAAIQSEGLEPPS